MTLRPARASSRATTAPPAPEPTTTDVGPEVEPLAPLAPAPHVQRASFSHRFLTPSPG